MEKDKIAAIAANLDETQIVSLQDLEELERLQIVGIEAPAMPRRRVVPLSAALGLLAAVALAAVLGVIYVHQAARPAAARTAVSGSH